MFWLFILALSVILAWSLLPEKDNEWSVLDDKNQRKKPPEVRRKIEYLGEVNFKKKGR